MRHKRCLYRPGQQAIITRNDREPDSTAGRTAHLIPARCEVSGRIRYQAQSVLAEQAGVTTYRGVDPVTGLPVLIYRFSGAPDPALARLDSEYLPRLLAWREDDDSGVMVVAWSSALVPAAEGELDNARLLDAARALADAAAAGLTHGDLRKERFMTAGPSVVLEGFGVPWQPDSASQAADVRDWASSVLQLGYQGHGGVREFLEEIASGGSTLDAAALLEQLRDLLLRSEPVPVAQVEEPGSQEPDGAEELPADFEPQDLSWDDGDSTAHRSAFGTDGSPLQEDAEPATDTEAARAEEEPLTDSDHADDDPLSSTFVPSETFASERLTQGTVPAATAASGARTPARRAVATAAAKPGDAPADWPEPESEATAASRPVRTERSGHRVIMIVALLVLSAVLAVLVLFLRRDQAGPVQPQAQQAITYVIDVLVEPADLPPVNLYVLQSPAGSQFTDGTILGTAPRRIALDAEGTWVFEGRFQGRVSESVTISIPEDRSSSVTITIPPAAAADED